MARQRKPGPATPPQPRRGHPRDDDWLLVTDADRALAGLKAAFDRTSRWQGDAH